MAESTMVRMRHSELRKWSWPVAKRALELQGGVVHVQLATASWSLLATTGVSVRRAILAIFVSFNELMLII